MVTGGAGFIGGHTTELLVSEGHDVLVFDNFSTGHRENLAAVADKIEVVEADICDPAALTEAMKGIDYVIHLAAEISNPKSVEDPIWANSINVDGTLNVLIAARDAGVKRLMMASSCAIYGDTGDKPQREDFLPHPLSPYGATKICGEHYLSVFHQIYGLETVRLRYFNVFGPRQSPKSQYAAAIPIFIDRILRGEAIHIFGDGKQTRDFAYVGDVARANYLACTVPQAAGEVFNVSGGQSIDLNELVGQLKQLAGHDVEVVYDPAKVGDIKYSSSDPSKARDILGYVPSVSFAEGLKRAFTYLAAKSGATS
jgi:UDP-glucose 4-epimerase